MRSLFLLVLALLPAIEIVAEGPNGGGVFTSPAPAAAQEEPIAPGSTESPEAVVAYQVGAFSLRANAERLIAKLGEHDIVGDLYRKTVRGRLYWVVAVAASMIPFENRQAEIQDAGYSSFPINRATLNSKMTAVADR